MAVRSLFKLRGSGFTGNYKLLACFGKHGKVRDQRVVCVTSHYHGYCSQATVSAAGDIEVKFENGLPTLFVPLPSRREVCQFTLRPVSNTLADFITSLQTEDQGIDRVTAYSTEGTRIAQSTSIDILLQRDFNLVINDLKYSVRAHQSVVGLREHTTDLGEVKTLVSQLFSTLNIEQHQFDCEKELLSKLEDLKMQIEPLEKMHNELADKASKRTRVLSWVGLGMMSLQFGILARLTWWEYSWDIMEPVTYFITYGTSMAMFAYYVLTRQEYNFVDVRDREYLITLHKHAKKRTFDMNQYNKLREAISQTEYDLQRLRDPLELHLPIQHLKPKKAEQHEL